MKKRAAVDKPLALLILVLLVGGCMIFASAAFGLLARGATNMSSVVFSHLVLGVGLGAIALMTGAAVDYHRWRRFAPYIYALAIIATLAVFIPQIGFGHGGARRWILLAGFSFQPSELLKIASILLAASYFAAIKTKVSSFMAGARARSAARHRNTRYHLHIGLGDIFCRRRIVETNRGSDMRRCCRARACRLQKRLRTRAACHIHLSLAGPARSVVSNQPIAYCSGFGRSVRTRIRAGDTEVYVSSGADG